MNTEMADAYDKLSDDAKSKLSLWKQGYLAALSAVAGTNVQLSYEVEVCVNHADRFVQEYLAKMEELK